MAKPTAEGAGEAGCPPAKRSPKAMAEGQWGRPQGGAQASPLEIGAADREGKGRPRAQRPRPAQERQGGGHADPAPEAKPQARRFA